MRWCWLIFLFVSLSISAQTLLDTSYFDSPVKYDMVLAGSFGELRGTHFHAGIDIKPSSKRDSIFTAAPGYVSRIKVQTGGYGRVLYIDHPNGYTSVYAHLEHFSDEIESYIKDLQLASQSYSLDIYPQADKFKLDRQEYIGLLGNTGRSYGAHLHFEIRKTNSETPINPALFGLKPTDHKSPSLVSVSVHGLSTDMQDQVKLTYPVQRIAKGKYTINKGRVNLGAWRAGLLLQGWDTMDGASNKNGIYRIEMYADDSLKYAATVDSVSWEESPYIKSHMDYCEKKKNKRTAIRCHLLPGNKLSLYDAAKDGVLKVYESKPRRIKIVAKDIEGNQSQITFDLYRGKVDDHSQTYEKLLQFGQAYGFGIGSCRLHIHEDALDRNLYMNYSQENIDGKTVYHIHRDESPLYRAAQLSMPIDHWVNKAEYDKLCLVQKGNKGITNVGGTVVADSLQIQLSNWGTYYQYIDVIAPTIKAVSLPHKGKTPTWIKFRISDDIKSGGQAASMRIDAYLDDQWIVGRYKSLDRIFRIDTRMIPKGKHHLRIVATDPLGNKTYWEKDILF